MSKKGSIYRTKPIMNFNWLRKGLPCSYAIQKKTLEMNSESVIYQTTGKIIGVRQSLLGQLNKTITYLAKIDQSFKENKNIRVKLTGDGTSISRSTHCVIIAFSIIREGANPNSPGGNHTVAILHATEDYDCLAKPLKEIVDEIKDVKSMVIDDTEYTIEWFLGADLKFLAFSTGLSAANSKYTCVWCKCPSADRHDITQQWSINDIKEGD